MVAYSYQPEFVDPTHSGRKRHTIRKNRTGRSRHARPGEALQHYTGMRTKNCRLFARSICRDVRGVRIQFGDLTDIVTIEGREPITSRRRLNTFAMSDGFTNWAALRAFWSKHHPTVIDFRGVIIFWRDLEPVR